jgi:hypothetical protein
LAAKRSHSSAHNLRTLISWPVKTGSQSSRLASPVITQQPPLRQQKEVFIEALADLKALALLGETCCCGELICCGK